MTQVFISYKRDNLQAVQPLVKALRDEGLEVWWDQDIAPGAPWEQTIEQEHDRAKVLIVAWSKAAVLSENVRAEARLARTQGKLLQVFVEPCEPPMFFGERQGIDFTGWDGARTDRRFVALLAATRAVIEGKTPEAGVGFAPGRRNDRAIAIAAVGGVLLVLILLALAGGARNAMCSLPALGPTCRALKLVPPPPPDPAVLAAQAERTLIRSLDGRWDRADKDCATPTLISTSVGSDGLGRIKVSRGAAYVSEGQIIGQGNGVVTSRDIAVHPGQPRGVWEYRPKGDQMTVIAPDGSPTPLVRCNGHGE